MIQALARFWCWLRRDHRWYVIETFSPYSRKLGCRTCPGIWGMHDKAQVVIPWDAESEALHHHEEAP